MYLGQIILWKYVGMTKMIKYFLAKLSICWIKVMTSAFKHTIFFYRPFITWLCILITYCSSENINREGRMFTSKQNKLYDYFSLFSSYCCYLWGCCFCNTFHIWQHVFYCCCCWLCQCIDSLIYFSASLCLVYQIIFTINRFAKISLDISLLCLVIQETTKNVFQGKELQDYFQLTNCDIL